MRSWWRSAVFAASNGATRGPVDGTRTRRRRLMRGNKKAREVIPGCDWQKLKLTRTRVVLTRGVIPPFAGLLCCQTPPCVADLTVNRDVIASRLVPAFD